MEIKWNENARKEFENVTASLPQFHRSIAERLVKEKAEILAKERNSQTVEEEDLIRAFFQEVPPAFKEMMKRLFQQHNIDFSKYVDG